MSKSTDRRDRVMSALSAAEHLVSVCPVSPDSVEIQQSTHFPPNALGVDLHFYRSTAALATFAQSMGVEPAAVTREFGGAWFTEATAAGVLGGVPFYAWTRVPVAGPAKVEHLSAVAV